jgi:hypothetical protein
MNGECSLVSKNVKFKLRDFPTWIEVLAGSHAKILEAALESGTEKPLAILEDVTHSKNGNNTYATDRPAGRP